MRRILSSIEFGRLMPTRYFIGGILFFIPVMYLAGRLLEGYFPRNDAVKFIYIFPLVAVVFFTLAFFTRGTTRKVVLLAVSFLVLSYLGPLSYFACIILGLFTYLLLETKWPYRTKLVVFVAILLAYWLFTLYAVLALPSRIVGWAALFFAIGIIKRSSYLFYERASEKITEISLLDFMFYLTYLPLAFPPVPVSPSEFLKGLQPTKKFPLHKTFFRGLLSVAQGVAKISFRLFVLYKWFPILRFGEMYLVLDSLSAWEVWAITLVNYFLWFLHVSSWFDISLGLSNMCGIRIKPNFNLPLFARDPLDLWKRWNIHTRGWLLRVFYFPLWWRYKITLLNVLIVFIISGYLHTSLGFVRLSLNWGYFLYFIVQAVAVMIVMVVKRGVRVSGTGETRGWWNIGTLLSIAATYAYTSFIHIFVFANFMGLGLYETFRIMGKALGLG